ncbi:hypothetical protein D3C87_1342460 [compost metagenome]
MVGQVGPFVGHAVGQFFLEQLFYRRLGLAGAVAWGRTAVDFGGDETVVVRDPVRPRRRADLDEGRQRDHLAAIIAHLQLTNLLRLLAELLLCLHVDLIGPAKTVEVVGVQRAQVHLQSVEDVVDLHAVSLGFLAVDRRFHLRHVDRVAGEQIRQFRNAAAFGDDVHGFFVQLVVSEVTPVFDLQTEAADGAQTLHGRWREHRDVGVLNAAELGVQRSGNRPGGQARVLALIEWAQTDEGDTGVRAVGEAVDRQAGERHGAVETRFVHGDGAHAPDDRFRAIKAGGIRQLREGH